jgi:hypothetical protein
MAASGVHHLIANHQQILSETVYRNFEVPLLHEIDGWTRRMEEEEVTYQRAAKEMSKDIRRMEKEGLRLHQQRKRDVAKFRGHLVDLTTRLDGLTSLHGEHSRALLRDSQETSMKIVESCSSLVRAEVDIFEALARKGWSGGGLDDLLDRGVDLFANEPETGLSDNGSKLFSILPQKSILADATSDQASGNRPLYNRNDSLLDDGDRYQSLAGAVSNIDRNDDAASIFSERTRGNFNQSRGARPFSPPPLIRNKVTLDTVEDIKAAGPVNDSVSTNTAVRELLVGESEETTNMASAAGDERGRERRWSVTDDGALSE